MKIFLLTHQRELHRSTNTGALAIKNTNNIVERILWERLSPHQELVRLIDNNDAVLLYAKAESSQDLAAVTSSKAASLIAPVTIKAYENIIIIDGTWQESKKIFNQSVYLKNAPQFTLKTANDSVYKLRANQPKGGLCTIECIMEVLKLKGRDKMAAELLVKFQHFNG